MLDSLVLSGTKFAPGAPLTLGAAITSGLFAPKNLIFWNNDLGSEEGSTSEGVQALIEIVRAAVAGLTELHFTDNSLFDEGAAALGVALAGAPAIRKLTLSGNTIGPAGIAALTESLVGGALTSISVTGVEGGANRGMSNRVEGDGAAGIRAMLEHRFSRLKTLVLSGANLGDDGVEELCEGLKGNTVLRSLDLHRNSITDEGAKALAEVLPFTAVQLLILTANRLTDEGVEALAAAARQNPVLEVVDVDMNVKVSDSGRGALAAALSSGAPVGRHEEL